jgi:isoleucyl-tRNA synthetase
MPLKGDNTTEAFPSSLIILAESRVEYVQSHIASGNLKILKRGIPGRSLVGNVKYRDHFDRGSIRPVIAANFVTSSAGTGLVHIAPGHGHDDYFVAKSHGIDAFAPVDHRGHFTAEALPSNPDILKGKAVVTEGTEAVLSFLSDCQQYQSKDTDEIVVLATHEMTHKYPIDWRTKQPVIIKATEQWFADIDSIKADSINSLDSIKFLPEAGKTRLQSFVEGRSQWCISRQRAWGMPVPALFRTDVSPHQAIMTPESIDHIMATIKDRGIEAWWSDPEDERGWIPSGLEGTYIRGKDTMDVWFDSGTSWSQLEHSSGKAPADIYIEGSDQHRGWFQSSLLTYIAHQMAQANTKFPAAPFKTLITHGFALDSEGRKMSKSLGNIISADDITGGKLLPPLKVKKTKGNASNPSTITYDAMGADVLRYWVASTDYTKDVSIGPLTIKPVQMNLQKIRITFKWLLGVLASYDPSGKGSQGQSTMPILDMIALHLLNKVSTAVHNAFASYDFVSGTLAINGYIHQDLSSFYFETLKDRLYAGSSSDRIAAQEVLFQIFNELLVILGPITPLLVEEVWTLTPEQLKKGHEHPLRRVWRPISTPDCSFTSKELDVLYMHLTTAKRLIGGLQEQLRNEGKIGSSLQSDVLLSLATNDHDQSGRLASLLFSPGNEDLLASTLVVSNVHLTEPSFTQINVLANGTRELVVEKDEQGNSVTTSLVAKIGEPTGCKCERCWRYLELSKHGLCGRCEEVVREEHPHVLVTS